MFEFCLIKRLTGFPCPGCGMTRALIEFVKGNLSGAFEWHPLFWLVPIFIAAIFFYVKKPAKWNKISLYAIAFLFVAVYVVRLLNGWRG